MVKYSKLHFSLAAGLLVLCLTMAGTSSRAENLTLTFDAPQYRIVKADNGEHVIEMDNFDHILIPGKPFLPAKTYMIALPPGATVTSVDITGIASVELEGAYRIRPSAPLLPVINDQAMAERWLEEWQQSYDATYLSDDAYPGTAGEYRGYGGLRKYTFARATYTPFSYQPQSGRLTLIPSVTVSIDYSLPVADDPTIRKRLRDTKADRQAAEFFVNYDQARPWYKPSPALPTYDEAYSYVIVYADGLQQAAEDYRDGHPISDDIALVSVPYISDNYSGVDLPEKIRNYLTEKFLDWGLQWVLLLGDITELPMRHTFPYATDYDPNSEYNPPTDFYYSDLNFTWDEDGDGYYGEWGEDLCDFSPELHVGRIPYSDPATVTSILDKILAFQYDTGDWKNNALLLGAMFNYENQDRTHYDRTDNADLMEVMIADMLGDFTYITEYEKEGLSSPAPYTCDYPITYANAIGQWASGDFGIVNWGAHGNDTLVARKWWAWDDGDGVPEEWKDEEIYEVYREYFVHAFDALSLDNDHPSIVFSNSCGNGWPEHDNLAKNLLKNGSAGIVAHTRSTHYRVGWVDPEMGGCSSIDYYFFDYMINGGQRIGEALSSSKLYTYNNLFLGAPSALCLYSCCLYGDPYTLREGESVVCCDLRGDVDHSGFLDPLDAIYLVNYLWAGGPEPPCLGEADVDGSGGVDPLDPVYLVNYFWMGGPPPVPCP